MAQLVCHPLLLEVLHGYLGPRCRCATFSSNTLLPQGAQQRHMLTFTRPMQICGRITQLVQTTMHTQCLHSYLAGSLCWLTPLDITMQNSSASQHYHSSSPEHSCMD